MWVWIVKKVLSNAHVRHFLDKRKRRKKEKEKERERKNIRKWNKQNKYIYTISFVNEVEYVFACLFIRATWKDALLKKKVMEWVDVFRLI